MSEETPWWQKDLGPGYEEASVWELVICLGPACVWALLVLYYLLTWEPPCDVFRG